MKIIFYDVEHGSCCHIITPKNMHILVDIGSKTQSSIVRHINRKYFGGRGGHIDELIITHPHEDHIYDLPNLNAILSPRVLQRQSGAFDIIPALNTSTHVAIADAGNKMNKSYNQPLAPGTAPTDAEVNGGVEFSIIIPKEEWTSKNDINTFSSIIVVKYSGYKFVLTGDNPTTILQKMMDTNYRNIKNEVQNATVLLAPHHGRANEFCSDFFKCVNPYLTVVSDKSIVHGTQENSAHLYKGRGADLYGQRRYVLTTRNDGTISFDVGENHCIVTMGEEDY